MGGALCALALGIWEIGTAASLRCARYKARTLTPRCCRWLGRPRVEDEAVDRAHAALAGGASLRGAMRASGASMAVVRRIKAAATQQPVR